MWLRAALALVLLTASPAAAERFDGRALIVTDGRMDRQTPAPLVLVLHGLTGSGRIMQRKTSFDALARAPGDWARSLYKRPWHSNPRLQTLDFPTFIRTPWESIADRETDFENINADLEFVGTEIQWDRHPITGAPFANIFEMRNLKHRALLGLPARGASVVYVQMDAFNAAPEAFLADISAAFHLNPTRRGYAPQQRRMGNAWSKTADTRHPLPEDWSLKDAEWMYSQLDPQLEDILGFGPD